MAERAGATRILIWSAEWATPRSPRGQAISSSMADVICLTEGYRELLPSDGRVIESEYGYALKEGRRKVWSWTGWTDVDSIGHHSLPPGRLWSH